MIIDLQTILHVMLSMALLASQFCRAIATDKHTRLPILLAFYSLTAAAVFSLFAPIVLKGWRPSWETVALLAAITAVQVVTARYWRNGTPRAFQNEGTHYSTVD